LQVAAVAGANDKSSNKTFGKEPLPYGQMREAQGAPQVDNTYLVDKEVDLHDIVYRTSLVLGSQSAMTPFTSTAM